MADYTSPKHLHYTNSKPADHNYDTSVVYEFDGLTYKRFPPVGGPPIPADYGLVREYDGCIHKTFPLNHEGPPTPADYGVVYDGCISHEPFPLNHNDNGGVGFVYDGCISHEPFPFNRKPLTIVIKSEDCHDNYDGSNQKLDKVLKDKKDIKQMMLRKLDKATRDKKELKQKTLQLISAREADTCSGEGSQGHNKVLPTLTADNKVVDSASEERNGGEDHLLNLYDGLTYEPFPLNHNDNGGFPLNHGGPPTPADYGVVYDGLTRKPFPLNHNDNGGVPTFADYGLVYDGLTREPFPLNHNGGTIVIKSEDCHHKYDGSNKKLDKVLKDKKDLKQMMLRKLDKVLRDKKELKQKTLRLITAREADTCSGEGSQGHNKFLSTLTADNKVVESASEERNGDEDHLLNVDNKAAEFTSEERNDNNKAAKYASEEWNGNEDEDPFEPNPKRTRYNGNKDEDPSKSNPI